MTAPAGEGIDRLIHFVEARITQLGMSKEEVARRGGPAVDTLVKIRGRRDQQTPMVGTLLRLDAALGWQPGSAAVVLLGGRPLSLTARSRATARLKKHVPQPLGENEIMSRLAAQLHDEIARLEGDRDAVTARIHRLRSVYDHFIAELAVDDNLTAAYGLDGAGAPPDGDHGRVLSPSSLSGRASTTPGPVMS
jgi:hypothetical protein